MGGKKVQKCLRKTEKLFRMVCCYPAGSSWLEAKMVPPVFLPMTHLPVHRHVVLGWCLTSPQHHQEPPPHFVSIQPTARSPVDFLEFLPNLPSSSTSLVSMPTSLPTPTPAFLPWKGAEDPSPAPSDAAVRQQRPAIHLPLIFPLFSKDFRTSAPSFLLLCYLPSVLKSPGEVLPLVVVLEHWLSWWSCLSAHDLHHSAGRWAFLEICFPSKRGELWRPPQIKERFFLLNWNHSQSLLFPSQHLSTAHKFQNCPSLNSIFLQFLFPISCSGTLGLLTSCIINSLRAAGAWDPSPSLQAPVGTSSPLFLLCSKVLFAFKATGSTLRTINIQEN